MAVYSNDGKIRVTWVTVSIPNIASPVAATLNGGVQLAGFITKDGLTVPADQNNVDVAVLADTFDAQVPGSFGGAIEITGVRDAATDTFWDACIYGTGGWIVIRRGLPTATTYVAAQKVEVYPAIMHEPVPAQTGGNTVGQFTISFPVSSQPNLKAVVV